MVKNLFHNDSLIEFKHQIFEGILNKEHVRSKKKSITLFKEKYYGYFLEKGTHSYFLKDLPGKESVLDILPIEVTKSTETDYNKNVFYFIEAYDSVKIPNKKIMKFNILIDTISNFEHTNKDHWLLYKLLTIAGWCDRVNYRVIGELGFGKDSVVNNLKDLMGDTKNLYGATFANLEYSLKYKFLIFNEMGNIKADDKINMQQFLLATGAFANTYAKKSKATEDTLEEYDISKTSLCILYNPPSYYYEKGQGFFDTLFTQAVHSRFIPFYLEGRLNQKFDAEFDVKKVVDENLQTYKDCISTLLYYRDNPIKNQFDIPDDIEFGEKTRRYERTFLKLCDYISEYAINTKDPKETYYRLVYALYESYKKYGKVLSTAIMAYDKD